MALPAEAAATREAALNRAGGLRHMARQPILDLRGKVHAYELLFRDGLENAFRGDGEMASRTIVDNAVIFGLEDLTAGLPAFVNCTGELITGELAEVLPPETAVLEILETVDPTPELIASCRLLKAQGFRLALDDFVWRPMFVPLVEMADYIKVDFLATNAEQRQELFQQIRGHSAAMVAEKVESIEEHNQARREGFTLFQGYYFCRPVMMEKRKIPSNRLHHFEILQLLHTDPMDFRRLGPLVKSDASLTHRLLRLVNSAGFGIRREVTSIHSALVIVGEENFRRMATLAIASELNAGRPAEILRMALIRARFCELAAALCAMDATEQYLLGMLSLFPAMLQIPIEEITPMLPLRTEICQSLQGAAKPERRMLAWLESHERGDWPASDLIVHANGLNREMLFRFYAAAVPWAESTLRSTI
jgi:c-di-GMP-related signal transduction protein